MITILTPSYNRAHTLTRLFESLIQQSNQNFEWLIVDDGSHDKTFDLVSDFIGKNKINIKYFFQENNPTMHRLHCAFLKFAALLFYKKYANQSQKEITESIGRTQLHTANKIQSKINFVFLKLQKFDQFYCF